MWYSSTPPDVAAAAPKCFSSVRSGREMSPTITGWSSPATPPAKYPSIPQSWNDSTVRPSTEIRCVPRLFSSRWLPQQGIFPVSDAAPVDAIPSQLVRAPSTEFA